MKRKTKFLKKASLILLASFIPSIVGCSKANDENFDDGFVDPIQYENDRIVSIKEPDRRVTRSEDAIKVPDVVKLHYHNDDNACQNRRFYTWVTGVDGLERKPDNSSPTEIDITLDFTSSTDTTLNDYANMPSLFVIIKVAGTWSGQSEDTEISYADYQDAIITDGGKKVLELWTIPGEGNSIEIYKTEAESKLPKIQTAKFTDFKTIECKCTIDDEGKPTEKKWVPLSYRLYAFDKSYFTMTESAQKANKEHYLFKTGQPSGNVFNISFNYTAKINVQYMIESVFPGYEAKTAKVVASCENLYESSRFNQYYNYEGSDLGMTYKESDGVASATFKLWSPISSLVRLNLFDTGVPSSLSSLDHPGSDDKQVYTMNYTKGGVWQITLTGTPQEIKGKYYTYSLTHSSGTVEAMDPYAKACGINGLRGYVYDKDSSDVNPEGWDLVPSVWNGVSGFDIDSPQRLSIYEVHIRDLTMDESWGGTKTPGTYQAFYEKGTRLPGHETVTTGFDHIEELGVKAIQLLPVFDNDNDERPSKMKFNWGYNPLNYNCVDGGYSSDPYDPLVRINEYKNLVMAYANNANHCRVIMDVVYNHVSSASSSCFTKVMPKYYFRYDENWAYYDGSGCSNEVKTDAPMMSKYVVDSLLWWAKEYKIKGFRFDLMGLIDTWTLRSAKEKLNAYDPDIVIYGEGWTSGGYHGKTDANNGGADTKMVYSQLYESPSSPGKVGGFNNGSRDGYRGGNDDGYNGITYPTWGFVSKTYDVGNSSSDVVEMLKGANPWGGTNPEQTINYVSCHDNYTLWDQLRYTLAESYTGSTKVPSGAPSVQNVVEASVGAHAAVMLSNGIAFMQGGEELYRTKNYGYNFDDYKKLKEEGLVRPYPEYPNYSSDPDQEYQNGMVTMYGERDIVAHNSYKSPDYVNSFKWDRKLNVDGYNTAKYFDMWKAMVAVRSDMKFISYEGNHDDYSAWGAGDGSTAVGCWSRSEALTGKGYGFMVANRSGGTFSWGGISVSELVFANKDGYHVYSDSVSLPAFGCVCFKLNG